MPIFPVRDATIGLPTWIPGCRICLLATLVLPGLLLAQQPPASSDIWPMREVSIEPDPRAAKVRIGIWDSGADTSLFTGRLARDASGRALIRGYDAFERRQDTPMEVLEPSLLARRDELNALTSALDDLDTGVDSPAARALAERMERMTAGEAAEAEATLGRWGGYAHGTAVADVALAAHGRAELVIARMEWWHGSPPVPCWSRELGVREASSIADLLAFLVASGVRVVNMSWGRHERSYLRNLEECAPEMPVEERQVLARFTVDTIRAVLRSGIEGAPHVLFVGAAGNGGQSVTESNPATRLELPNFLLVGAVDRAGNLADFSNTGPEVSLYANGWRVPGRLPGGAAAFGTGTSMAAPVVSNAAAKVLAVNPGLTGAEVRRILELTADAGPAGQRLLHAARAVAEAREALKEPVLRVRPTTGESGDPRE